MVTQSQLLSTVDTLLSGLKKGKHLPKEVEVTELEALERRVFKASSNAIYDDEVNGVFYYRQLVKQAENTLTLLDRLSRKLVVLSKFLLEVAENFMTSGKLSIKWWQYPKVISMLLSFLKEIVAA